MAIASREKPGNQKQEVSVACSPVFVAVWVCSVYHTPEMRIKIYSSIPGKVVLNPQSTHELTFARWNMANAPLRM